MKLFFCFVMFALIITLAVNAQTPLSVGDIAIIGVEHDVADDFSFLILKDIEQNTIIKFTDCGWNATMFMDDELNQEGCYCYTAPAAISAGTIINYINNAADFTFLDDPPILNGTVPFLSLSGGGDQLIAYTGNATSPNFLHAVNTTSYNWAGYDLAAPTYSTDIPTSLVNAVSCIAVGAGPNNKDEYDNARYIGPQNLTGAAMFASINTLDNWERSDDALVMPTGSYSLPVELVSFAVDISGGNVILKWTTATEVNNYGFEIDRWVTRNVRSETWEKIGFVVGNGTANSPKDYEFTDSELPNSDEVSYRLKQIDNDGTFTYSKIITVDLKNITSVDDEVQYSFSLDQNYPNPFNPTTKIEFTIPSNVKSETSEVRLVVYNSLGQQVATLVNERKSPGTYEVEFNASGLSSGVYFYSMEILGADQPGNFFASKKMILIK